MEETEIGLVGFPMRVFSDFLNTIPSAPEFGLLDTDFLCDRGADLELEKE